MLRTLFKSDIPQILEIEKAVHIAPWTEDTFNTCFETGCLGWAVEIDQKIIGFIVVSLRVEECHILNLCVTHQYQRQGYGRKLLEYALNQVRHKGAGIAYLEVRRSNTRAISLYENMKFFMIGERKDYYPITVGGYEDALIYAKSLVQDLFKE